MPVTKTAKRALRSSLKKKIVNDRVNAKLEILTRGFRKNKTTKNAIKVFSAIDRAAKNHVIHKNKAARIKARIEKLLKAK